MIIESSKLKDVCESVLYSEARAKMDSECAAAGDDSRMMLEDIADIVGERIKNDTEACQKVLDSSKNIKNVYDNMRAVVEKRVKLERGKVVCGTMSSTEARRIALEYYGITDVQEKKESDTLAPDKVKSIYDFL